MFSSNDCRSANDAKFQYQTLATDDRPIVYAHPATSNSNIKQRQDPAGVISRLFHELIVQADGLSEVDVVT